MDIFAEEQEIFRVGDILLANENFEIFFLYFCFLRSIDTKFVSGR